MGYCTSNIVIDSISERIDKFYNDIDYKYGENYLWMKMFFDMMEKRNNYYKEKWKRKFDERGK